MANLNSDQAKQLSDNFYYLAIAIGDFRYQNWERLSLDENKELSDIQNSLLRFGEDILAYATTLVMDEVIESLQKINVVTQEINGTIKDLTNIQKGLNVAAAVLILGVAILNRDPKGIGNAIKDVYATWTAPLI